MVLRYSVRLRRRDGDATRVEVQSGSMPNAANRIHRSEGPLFAGREPLVLLRRRHDAGSSVLEHPEPEIMIQQGFIRGQLIEGDVAFLSRRRRGSRSSIP